jgi:AraC-like DNA-binding protein
LRTHRLERAKQMLAQDPETIAEVAYAVGFTSPSSFSRSFRDEVGCPPSDYVDRQATG